MMYNPRLETFVCVADAGSFNKAAATLYITPTAVVKQVNLLERSLGLTLFTRTHRGLVLTEAGKSLYKDSKYIIRYCKASVLRAKSAGGEEKVIRIGTSPMTPGQFLVDLWPKVHSLCPDIKFELVPYENTPENAREILANLGQNDDSPRLERFDGCPAGRPGPEAPRDRDRGFRLLQPRYLQPV